MKSSLNLTETQAEKVAAINLKYAQDSQALREAGGGRDALRRRREELRKRRDAELRMVLTGSQFLAFQQAREKRGRGGPGRGGGSGDEGEGGGEKED
jgi:Spy/CpxP family protein refolding chaperone